MRFLPLILVLLSGLGSLGAQGPISRYLVTFEDISDQPRLVTLTGLGLEVEVVETFDDKNAVTRKSPGSLTAGPLEFALPEIGDETVLFKSWMRRIRQEGPEAHHGTIVGYDRDGRPIARWNFENAWPSKHILPILKQDGDEALEDLRSTFVMQVDSLMRVALDGTAPWPKILSLKTIRTNPGTPQLLLEWRSVAEATYSIYAWDPVDKSPVLKRANIVADGPKSSIAMDIDGTELLYIVLTSPPPEVP